MSSAIHISGIRIAHVEQPDRGVRVNRPTSVEGPIRWSELARVGHVSARHGRGSSGLRYRIRQQDGWKVTVISNRHEEVEIGSARMQDHALALANMWEDAVLSGRIDMS